MVPSSVDLPPPFAHGNIRVMSTMFTEYSLEHDLCRASDDVRPSPRKGAQRPYTDSSANMASSSHLLPSFGPKGTGQFQVYQSGRGRGRHPSRANKRGRQSWVAWPELFPPGFPQGSFPMVGELPHLFALKVINHMKPRWGNPVRQPWRSRGALCLGIGYGPALIGPADHLQNIRFRRLKR